MSEYDRIKVNYGKFSFSTKNTWWLQCFNAKALSFNNVAIVFVKGNYYKIQFRYMSQNEAINLLRNTDLTEKSGAL